jgi:hypothetical protein
VKGEAILMEKEARFEALNPRGIKPTVEETPPSPRVTDLSGKVVYCVSQHVRGTDTFVEKVVEQLPKYAAGVEAVYVDKPGFFSDDVPELWDEIANKADALIYAAAA